MRLSDSLEATGGAAAVKSPTAADLAIKTKGLL